MSELIWVFKHIGAPGSIGFLSVCLVGGLLVALTGPRGRRGAKVWLLLVFTAYIVAAFPFVAGAISTRLPPYGPAWKPDGSGSTDLLVVLSGDNALGRAREARRVLDAITPRCVLVSGDRWFVQMVIEAGVPRDRLIADDTTETTRAQIGKLPAWADRCGARRVILVASVLSMPRIAALIRTLHIPVVLAPSPLDSTPAADFGFRSFVPSYSALGMTRDALYEHLALAYYRHRQWIP